jgi:DNA-binding NarL/FixJ family response regulator
VIEQPYFVRPPPPDISIVLADDHPLVRAGIRSILSSIAGVRILAEAGDGRELLECLERVTPDVVITDISMPGMDGLTAMAEIRCRYPEVRVVVLSMHDTPEQVRAAMAAGACAYLPKDASDFELGSALHSVMTTGSYVSATVMQQLMADKQPSASDQLTQRQLEILVMLAKGMSSKEIGHALGLSHKTVDVHRGRIMERLGVRDVASLVVYAVRKGLIKL